MLFRETDLPLSLLLVVVLAGVLLSGIAAADVVLNAEDDAVETDDDPAADVEIDRALQTADGEVEAVVRFEAVDRATLQASDDAVETLKSQASTAQEPLQRYAAQTSGVTVENDFWIANAALVTVDTDEVALSELARIDGVDRIHENFEVTTMDGVDADSAATGSTSVETDDYETTYGLDMINATEVWDRYDTQGEGATVAVLDTGIDPDHPDLDLHTDDPDDPTYPGGYMAFDSDGNQLPNEEPSDSSGHGTHVSGTVAGSDDPAGVDEAFGVAPEATLLHGQVIPGGSGTFAQIAAGMEWAIDDTDAEVITMSLGADGYESDMTEPSENARDAGVVLVASAGNSGDGVSGSPGNVYPNFASGAVDADGNVASFSSGEVITTDEAYPDAPDYWPDEYTVPNAAAPGVDVLSAVPGGGYDGTYSGTSMSAPHKAGAFALMISASGGDADRKMLIDAMEGTAWKPDDWDEPDDEYDTRYGIGIIDVAAATDLVAAESGISGTVTDAENDAIENATISLDETGFEATTDENGEYTIRTLSDEHTITASAFGYEEMTVMVEVPDDETFVEQDFELTAVLDVALVENQPDDLEGGDSFDVTFDVANLETYAVERNGDYDGDLTLEFEGESIDEGEKVDVGDVTGEVTLSVSTEDDTAGEFELEHTFEGLDSSETITTGPTVVFEEFVPVAVVDDGDWGNDVVDRLDDKLLGYDILLITGSGAVEAATNDEYEAYVVQNIDEMHVEDFEAQINDPGTGVIWLDQWGGYSTGIPAKSNILENPHTYDQDSDSPRPDLEILADHPIFEDIGDVGDTVPIHGATFADHSWFDSYEGEVIGHIQAGGVTDGDGIGVDEVKQTVILSSFGSTFWVNSGDYTQEADKILANAVDYASSGPPAFSGSVTVGDNPAPEGAVIEAYIDDERRGSTVVETPGEYGTGDEALVVEGSDDDEGATITFTVDDIPVEETATWSAGGTESLDLNASGNATIDITLGDDRFEESITNATVTATGTYGEFDATENGSGAYVIEDLPADTYEVTADAPGYDPETNDSVTVGADGTTAVDFWLAGNGAINGTVVDGAAGQALTDASVNVTYPDDGPTTEPIGTNESGAFTVENVPGTGEAYTVEASALGYEPRTLETAVEEGETDVGTIELNGSASIAGTVEDADGEALSNVSIEATSGSNASYAAETDADGTYHVADVPGAESNYTVEFSKPGFAQNTTELESVSSDETDVNATLTQETRYFAVDEFTTPAEVEEGDSVTVEATITNLGTDDWNDTATLYVDGDELASRNVSLNGTENVTDSAAPANTTVSFSHEAETTGEVEYAIATENETASATVTVEEASSGGGIALPPPPSPEPSVSIFDATLVETEIAVDESATVAVTLRNTGDADGELTLDLRLDGSTVESTTVAVPAGERVETMLAHDLDEPGEYEVVLNDDVVGTITVAEPESTDEPGDDATVDADDTADDADPAADDGIPGFGVAVALVAFLTAALVDRRAS